MSFSGDGVIDSWPDNQYIKLSARLSSWIRTKDFHVKFNRLTLYNFMRNRRMKQSNRIRRSLSFLLVAVATTGHSFLLPNCSTLLPTTRLKAAKIGPEEIKRQLKEYLETRKQLNADEIAEQ